jgi:hypothetical protein
MTSLALIAAIATTQTGTNTLDVREAGIKLLIPKTWVAIKSEAPEVAKYRIPLKGSQLPGIISIGVLKIPEGNVDSYLGAQKMVAEQSGFAVVEQKKISVLDGEFGWFESAGTTSRTVRGIMFRPTLYKLTLALTGPADVFDLLRPEVLKIVESFKASKVATPAAEETRNKVKVFEIGMQNQRVAATPVAQALKVGEMSFNAKFVANTKVKMQSDGSMILEHPSLPAGMSQTLYAPVEGMYNTTAGTKLAQALELFNGATTRSDYRDLRSTDDGTGRLHVWRQGIAKWGRPLLVGDIFTVYGSTHFTHIRVTSEDAKNFERIKNNVMAFARNCSVEVAK